MLKSLWKSSGLYATRIPFPPPPKAAFIITGYPILSAIIFPVLESYTSSFVPGITGTFACTIVFLAMDLLPMFRIISEEGPINLILHCSHSSANFAFSERNPTPGCMASAPVDTAALNMLSIFK